MESFKVQVYKLIKRNIYVILAVLISLFFLLPYLGPQFPVTHDGQNQIARFAAYSIAFSDGQLVPRWAGGLNFSYGSPVFIFFYPLTGYLASFIRIFGFSFTAIFKILVFATFFLSIGSFYGWARCFVDKHRSIVAAAIYSLSPYMILNRNVRGDIGELMALSILPAVFLFIQRLKHKANAFNFFGTAVAFALLILSHQGITLIFFPVIIFYALFIFKRRLKVFLPIFSLTYGFLLSFFFWFPALYEAKYTNSNFFIGDMYKEHFLSFNEAFFKTWGFNPSVNELGGQSPQIGLFLGAIVIFMLIYFIKKRSKEVGFWLVVAFTSLFFVTSSSAFFWENLPLLKKLEFPWRIISLATFSTSTLLIFFFAKFKKIKVILILFILFLISCLSYQGVVFENEKSDSFYISYPGTTYFHGEATTIWTEGDAKTYPKSIVQIVSGTGKIDLIEKKSNFHKFRVIADTPVKVLDNTVYFPGWEIRANGRKVPIEFQDINHRGFITFNVDKGNHLVQVQFKETKARLISDLISLLSVFLIIFVSIIKKIRVVRK